MLAKTMTLGQCGDDLFKRANENIYEAGDHECILWYYKKTYQTPEKFEYGKIHADKLINIDADDDSALGVLDAPKVRIRVRDRNPTGKAGSIISAKELDFHSAGSVNITKLSKRSCPEGKFSEEFGRPLNDLARGAAMNKVLEDFMKGALDESGLKRGIQAAGSIDIINNAQDAAREDLKHYAQTYNKFKDLAKDGKAVTLLAEKAKFAADKIAELEMGSAVGEGITDFTIDAGSVRTIGEETGDGKKGSINA